MTENLKPADPADVVIEQAVLGAVLNGDEWTDEIFRNLRWNDFYRECHQKLFAAMESCWKKHGEIAAQLLTNEIMEAGTIQEIGGLAYMAVLMKCESSRRTETLIDDLRHISLCRQVIGACSEISRLAYRQAASSHLLQKWREAYARVVFDHYTARDDESDLQDLLRRQAEHRAKHGASPPVEGDGEYSLGWVPDQELED